MASPSSRRRTGREAFNAEDPSDWARALASPYSVGSSSVEDFNDGWAEAKIQDMEENPIHTCEFEKTMDLQVIKRMDSSILCIKQKSVCSICGGETWDEVEEE